MTAVPIVFKFYDGDEVVRTEEFEQDIIKIGKLASSHLCIEDDDVSRMHAVIEVSGDGEIFIIDLGSTAGTIVNDKKVNKCQIHDGDELQIGGTRIVVGVEEAAAALLGHEARRAERAGAAAGADGRPPRLGGRQGLLRQGLPGAQK